MSKEPTPIQTQLWRLNLKSQAVDDVNPQEFAIENNIAGVGWRVPGKVSDSASYWALGEEEYRGKGQKGWKTAMNAFHWKMQIGDLIWTRNSKGIYFLGQITGPWEYNSSQDFMNADLVNVRPCSWYEIGLQDAVPGKVVAAFRARSAVQKVHDDIACNYSQLRYNDLSGKNDYQPTFKETGKDFLKSCLSDQDWEDLVGLYLQVKKGYYLIPTTCKKDTIAYEFVLRHRDDGEKAVVQVKTGNEKLEATDYAILDKVSKVFLLDLRAEKDDTLDFPNVERLLAEELDAFAREYVKLMPDGIQFWMAQEKGIR